MHAASDRLRETFLGALKVATTQREAYLAEACAGDQQLRDQVERLLQAHDELGSLAEQPCEPLRPPVDKSAAERPGTVVGHYKLIELIGEGGMGTVWMAQQTEPVKRLVAVKLIKVGMDSPQVTARFEAERQALVLMDHPCLAKVLDGGTTPSGRPYFVMDLVKGVPITKYCDDHELAPRARLELFIPVCQAVQHAHQKGIIHRDLKPTNVLVALYDGKPVPKVIDFGVAKTVGPPLTEQTLVTSFGAVVGTPEYMSPEQADLNQLDIDTRSDIYSLGVLLYELMTGTTPLEHKRVKESGLIEALRIIREEEVPTLSKRLSSTAELPAISAKRSTEPAKLTTLVRGELEWIVMKALEKDRNRRYETANDLAMDLQRYLADEPVLAGPPSPLYRLLKFVRRNRVTLVFTSFIAFALLAVVTNRLLALQEVRAERDRALAAARHEMQARGDEARQKRYAQAIADFVLEDFLALTSVEGQSRFGSADDNLDKGTTLLQLLDRAAKKLDARQDIDPLVEAKLRWIMGVNYRGQGQYPEAVRHLAHCVSLRQRELGLENRETLDAMNSLGLAYKAAGQFDEAVTLLGETLVLKKSFLGEDHPNTLDTMNNLASAHQAAGQLVKGLPLYEETLQRRKTILGDDHPDTLISMNNLASAYQAAGQLARALPLLQENLRLRTDRLGAEHLDTLVSIDNLALAYQAAGQLDKALPLLEQALQLRRKRLDVDHPDTLICMNNLASGYQAAGQLTSALLLFEESLHLLKKRLGDDHPDTLICMNNLAMGYKAAGQLAKALPLFVETLQQRRAKLGDDHPNTLTSMNNLASAYHAAGQLAKALPLYEETLQRRRTKLGDDHPDTLISMNNLAMGYKAAGQLARALPLYEETLQQRRAKLGDDHPNTLTSMNNLASAYQAAGRLNQALPLYEETLQRRRANQGDDHPDTLISMNNLALGYKAAGQLAKALPLYEETLQRRRAKLGDDHPDTLVSTNNLALGYWTARRLDAALPLFDEAARGIEKRRYQHQNAGSIIGNTALANEEAKQFDVAESWRRKWLAHLADTVGIQSPDYLDAHEALGRNLLLQKKSWDESEAILRGCLARRQQLQPNAWRTFATMSLLGASLAGQERFDEAEPLLLNGHHGLQERAPALPQDGAPILRESIERFVQLYDAWGKSHEAETWRNKLKSELNERKSPKAAGVAMPNHQKR